MYMSGMFGMQNVLLNRLKGKKETSYKKNWQKKLVVQWIKENDG